MNPLDHDAPDLPHDLTHALRAATQWTGTETSLHAAALAAERTRRSFFSRLPRHWPVAAAALLAITLSLAIMPSMSHRARSSPTVARRAMPSEQAAVVSWKETERLGRALDPRNGASSVIAGLPTYKLPSPDAAPAAGPIAEAAKRQSPEAAALQAPSRSAPADEPRQVVRKVNLELKTHDVRGAFLKASQLISEAGGEFVEQSSLTGDDDTLYGSLTLRIAATRLSPVLNQLRGLGQVVQETAGGEDVTDQAVDLEARLRNEQKVETELLGLLESRKEAPLKDVLELRDSISRVREQIERLTAQRDRLSRLVSLATVLVIIRTDAARPSASAEDGIWTYAGAQIARSWRTALEFLADSVAFLVRVFIGGAIFWVIGALIVFALASLARRAARKRAREAAPALVTTTVP